MILIEFIHRKFGATSSGTLQAEACFSRRHIGLKPPLAAHLTVPTLAHFQDRSFTVRPDFIAQHVDLLAVTQLGLVADGHGDEVDGIPVCQPGDYLCARP